MNQELVWGTFYGSEIKFKDLSHQHLSNILWYHELVLECRAHPMLQAELDKRFGGIKLPYQPMISFTQEINTLVQKRYTSGEPNADIVVNGKWVGCIKYQ